MMMNDHRDDRKKVRGNDAEVKICVQNNVNLIFESMWNILGI